MNITAIKATNGKWVELTIDLDEGTLSFLLTEDEIKELRRVTRLALRAKPGLCA